MPILVQQSNRTLGLTAIMSMTALSTRGRNLSARDSSQEQQVPIDYTYPDIAKMIDHSLLNPALTVPELEDGCQLALRYNVASVCILPYYAARCAASLAGSTVHPST